MGRTRLRGTRKDPLTILRVLIWSLMRETQRVRQRVGPWPTVPPTPVCAWPSRPRSARSALGCGAGGAAAEGQEGLSSSVPGDTRRVEGLGPNVTAGPRSPRTAARVRLRDPRRCTLGTEGLCVTVRAPAAVNPRPPRLTWLLRPIWKPERAHRNHKCATLGSTAGQRHTDLPLRAAECSRIVPLTLAPAPLGFKRHSPNWET